MYRGGEELAGVVDGEAGNSSGVRLERVDENQFTGSRLMATSVIHVILHHERAQPQQPHHAVVKPDHNQRPSKVHLYAIDAKN